MAVSNRMSPLLKRDKADPEDFYYELPEARIAEYPVEPRDSSRLMAINRGTKTIHHERFTDLPAFLDAGDVLVVNSSKVYPAQIQAIKDDNKDPIDLFLLRELQSNVWEVSVDPARKVRIGNTLNLTDNLQCDVIDNTVSSGRVVVFDDGVTDVKKTLEEIGQAPLPPYIQREPEPKDKSRLQSIFADEYGSIAIPSAGLHFTESLIRQLEDEGINVVTITHHLGYDGYQFLDVKDLSSMDMQPERYYISQESADVINTARDNGHRIIAGGSSVVRALESAHFEGNRVIPGEDWTELFIYPPFEFDIVDGLVTNFHRPKSMPLILQSAFYNNEALMGAYQEALDQHYRFLGFGDAMLII